MIDIIYALWLRNVKRYLRSKSRIIGSLGMPLFFLFIVGFGLNSALVIPGASHNYVGFIIPGIISMSVLFTSIFSGIQIIWDRQFGFLKETLVAPVSRFEIMLGQTVGGATASIIQGTIILVISIFVSGAIPSFSGLLVAFVFMALIGLSFTALGILIATQLEDMQGFQLIMNFVVFPIFGLSGALFPLNNLPSWLAILATFDPLTYGVEGVRFGLFGYSQIDPVASLAALSFFCAVTVVVGGYLFNKTKV